MSCGCLFSLSISRATTLILQLREGLESWNPIVSREVSIALSRLREREWGWRFARGAFLYLMWGTREEKMASRQHSKAQWQDKLGCITQFSKIIRKYEQVIE